MSASTRFLRWGASALVLGLAGWLLWRQLRGLDPALVQAALLHTPPTALAASMLATAISFACLAAYERMATQWLAAGKVPRLVAWRVGLQAQALAATLGFHPITAFALRLRTYRAHGIDNATLAKIIATIGGCVAIGAVAILVLALAWSQVEAGRGVMVVMIAIFLATAIGLVRMRVRQMGVDSPVLAHVARLLAVGVVEMGAAVAALWVLMPAEALPGGPVIVLLYVTALGLSVVSHVPGGIGVFEATFLAAAPAPHRAQVLAALLAFRVVYNLLPCTLALLSIGVGRLRQRNLNSTADRRA